jgi:hypothetical protein
MQITKCMIQIMDYSGEIQSTILLFNLDEHHLGTQCSALHISILWVCHVPYVTKNAMS